MYPEFFLKQIGTLRPYTLKVFDRTGQYGGNVVDDSALSYKS